MIADITVVPKSGRFLVSAKEGRIKVFLKSPPEQNKANIELVRELSKVLGSRVRLLSGHRTRHKRLEIDVSQEEWKAFLSKNIKKP